MGGHSLHYILEAVTVATQLIRFQSLHTAVTKFANLPPQLRDEPGTSTAKAENSVALPLQECMMMSVSAVSVLEHTHKED